MNNERNNCDVNKESARKYKPLFSNILFCSDGNPFTVTQWNDNEVYAYNCIYESVKRFDEIALGEIYDRLCHADVIESEYDYCNVEIKCAYIHALRRLRKLSGCQALYPDVFCDEKLRSEYDRITALGKAPPQELPLVPYSELQQKVDEFCEKITHHDYMYLERNLGRFVESITFNGYALSVHLRLPYSSKGDELDRVYKNCLEIIDFTDKLIKSAA